jgi:hypothetical protein
MVLKIFFRRKIRRKNWRSLYKMQPVFAKFGSSGVLLTTPLPLGPQKHRSCLTTFSKVQANCQPDLVVATLLVSLYRCIVVLLYRCIVVLLYCCIVVLLYRCIVVLLYCCIVVLLYRCIIVLLYPCIVVSKYTLNHHLNPFY